MVGSCEPETARRFGSGTSRRGLDERDGVTIARHRGLKVVGTLAALDLAAAHGLVDLRTMFDRLRATTFRSPVRLMVSMLEQDAQRKKRQECRL